MKKIIFSIMALLLVLSIAVGCTSGAPATGEPIKLVYSTLMAESHSMVMANNWFFDELEKEHPGRLEIDKFYKASLIPSHGCLQALREATIEVGDLCIPYWPEELPISDAMAIPFITEDGWARARAANELVRKNEAFTQEYAKQGVIIIGFNASENVVMCSNKRLTSLNDLKGLKTRSYGQFAEFLKKLGANPISQPWGEVYQAAQTGLIEGCCTCPYVAHCARSHYEVLPIHQDMGWGSFTLKAFAISTAAWDKLPNDIKKTITKLGDAYTDKSMELMSKMTREGTQKIVAEMGDKSAFVVLTPEQRQQWIAPIGVDNVISENLSSLAEKGIDSEELWSDYMELIKKYDKKSDYELIWDIWEELGVAEPL